MDDSDLDIDQQVADAQLVRRTLDGDDRAFEALVRRYKSLMILVAYRRSGSESESEDIAQEALYRAYCKLQTLDDPARFKSWSMRITTNVARDWLRRKKKTISLEDERFSEDMVAPAAARGGGDPVSNSEARRLISQAIEELPEPYQLPAVLRYMENLAYREIAQRMGLREDTLRKRIHRANQILRKKLRPLLDEDDG